MPKEPQAPPAPIRAYYSAGTEPPRSSSEQRGRLAPPSPPGPSATQTLRPLRRRHSQRASSRSAQQACMTMHDQPAPKTHGFAADKVFLYCRAAPAARGPSPPAVGLIESHGAGASGSPGRDARMPPGLEERAPGWPAVGRVPADPGRSGPGDGRQRGIIQQARVPTDGRTPRNVAVEPAGAVPGRRGTGGCSCPVRRARSCHHAE